MNLVPLPSGFLSPYVMVPLWCFWNVYCYSTEIWSFIREFLRFSIWFGHEMACISHILHLYRMQWKERALLLVSCYLYDPTLLKHILWYVGKSWKCSDDNKNYLQFYHSEKLLWKYWGIYFQTNFLCLFIWIGSYSAKLSVNIFETCFFF